MKDIEDRINVLKQTKKKQELELTGLSQMEYVENGSDLSEQITLLKGEIKGLEWCKTLLSSDTRQIGGIEMDAETIETAVKLVDTDGHWYLVPFEEAKLFCSMVDEIECNYTDNSRLFDKFNRKFSKYATGGDADLVPDYYKKI